MKSFKDLLNTIRAKDPSLITQSEAEELNNQIDQQVNTAVDAAKEQGKKEGFADGFKQGKEVAMAQATKSFEDTIVDLDEDAVRKIKEVTDKINADHQKKLENVKIAMDAAIEAIQNQYKDQMQAMDQDYSNKLQAVANKMDETHAKMMEQAVQSVMRNCARKIIREQKKADIKNKKLKLFMEQRTEKLKGLIKENKQGYMKKMVDSVNSYLNYALQKAIPTKRLISEQKYYASQKAIEKITSILKINNILQESKDDIFKDYESRIQSSKSQANKLMVQNANLKNELGKKEAKILLESKIQKCVPAQADFLRTYFKNAGSKNVIEEQIEGARRVFKRMHDEKRAKMVEFEQRKASSRPTSTISEARLKARRSFVEEPEERKVVAESKQLNKTEQKHVEKPIAKDVEKDFATIYSEMLKH